MSLAIVLAYAVLVLLAALALLWSPWPRWLKVGLALGVRNLPLLFAGIPAGVVADRGDRVKLLQISGVTMAVGSALMGALVAAKLGSTRLIDNLPITIGRPEEAL